MIVARFTRPPRRTLLSRSLPKDRGSGDDRYAIGPGGRALALCDGASEGWDGAGWAAALASALVRFEEPQAAVTAARATRRAAAVSGDWLTSAAQARGSWSTALALRLSPDGREAQAAAVGDTVLFILDGCEPLASFPLDDPGAFGSTPELVAENGDEEPSFHRASFSLHGLRRPRLALVSDALAARALAEPRLGRNALWAFLLGASDAAFKAWVGAETEAGRLRRDDLTMLAAL